MTRSSARPTTSLASSHVDDVSIRGQSLCKDIIGQLSFTEMAFFLILGKRASPNQCALVDACLVTLMEHGLTPSAITTRLTYSSSPESVQAAVASGLLGVGSVFAGTMEGCAELLTRIVDSGEELDTAAGTIVREHLNTKKPIPGFGHPQHKPDDPRALKLLELADERQISSNQVAALRALALAVDAAYDKHITINATGAIAAILGDCGVPPAIMRGFALISRCAGLVAHVHEEQDQPAMRAIWQAAEQAVSYEDPSAR